MKIHINFMPWNSMQIKRWMRVKRGKVGNLKQQLASKLTYQKLLRRKGLNMWKIHQSYMFTKHLKAWPLYAFKL